MKIAVAQLKSSSPYSPGKHVMAEKLNEGKESAADWDLRTWRERAHWTEDGKALIPPMAFRNCLYDCAKFKSLRIDGKGKATWTKHFDAGIMVFDGIVLPVTRETILYEDHFVPADGRRGGSARVMRRFPIIAKWEGVVAFYVVDETITEDIFRLHLEEAGQFIGLGRWRARNGGMNGRFEVVGLEWGEG